MISKSCWLFFFSAVSIFLQFICLFLFGCEHWFYSVVNSATLHPADVGWFTSYWHWFFAAAGTGPSYLVTVPLGEVRHALGGGSDTAVDIGSLCIAGSIGSAAADTCSP
jgi:hypothetical protein